MAAMRDRPPHYSDFCYLCTTRDFIDDAMEFVRTHHLPLTCPPPAGESMRAHHAVGLVVSAYCFLCFPDKVLEHPVKRTLAEDVMSAAAEMALQLRILFLDGVDGTRKRPREDERSSLELQMRRFELACKMWQLAHMPFAISQLKESLQPGRVLDPIDTLPFPLSATQLFPEHPAVVALHASSFGADVDEALFRKMRTERVEELMQALRTRNGEENAKQLVSEAGKTRRAYSLRAHVRQLMATRMEFLSHGRDSYAQNNVQVLEAEIEYARSKLRKLIDVPHKYFDFMAEEFDRCQLALFHRSPTPLSPKDKAFADAFLAAP